MVFPRYTKAVAVPLTYTVEAVGLAESEVADAKAGIATMLTKITSTSVIVTVFFFLSGYYVSVYQLFRISM